jgi:uncharacterized protein YcaQ
MLELSKEQAQKYLINYQCLDNSINNKSKDGILDYLSRVGSIQYDTLNIVGRNPDLVMQSRIKNYKPHLLDELLYKDRKIIDGWDKMMSIYRISDWPYFHHLRKIREKSVISALKYRQTGKALNYIEKAIEIITSEGPKLSTQIDFGKTKRKGKWGHGKLAGATLDYLFHRGDIGVFCKNGSQKVYDLIQNILPKEILEKTNPFQTVKDFHKWLLKRRIGAIGLYWNKNSVVWQGIDKDFNTKIYREKIIEELLEEKSLLEVKVEEFPQSLYIQPEYPFKKYKTQTGNIKFLAPLDNLLWDREFIRKLFNFDYKWEVYTPVNQRKYGYYVLPVLYGNKFIARFEPKIDKKTNELVLLNWWWENNTKQTPLLRNEINNGLMNFTGYLKAKKYRNITDLKL